MQCPDFEVLLMEAARYIAFRRAFRHRYIQMNHGQYGAMHAWQIYIPRRRLARV
jgi:hypothetical protein